MITKLAVLRQSNDAGYRLSVPCANRPRLSSCAVPSRLATDSRLAAFFSKFEEDAALVKPVAHAPHDEQHGAVLIDRRERTRPLVVLRKRADRMVDPALADVRYGV